MKKWTKLNSGSKEPTSTKVRGDFTENQTSSTQSLCKITERVNFQYEQRFQRCSDINFFTFLRLKNTSMWWLSIIDSVKLIRFAHISLRTSWIYLTWRDFSIDWCQRLKMLLKCNYILWSLLSRLPNMNTLCHFLWVMSIKSRLTVFTFYYIYQIDTVVRWNCPSLSERCFFKVKG